MRESLGRCRWSGRPGDLDRVIMMVMMMTMMMTTMMSTMMTMVVAMEMMMIKLGVDVYGYLYLAGLFPSLYHYVVHGFLKRNFMVDSFLDYQGNVSSSSVDLYLGLLHRLPDWSFQLWW